MLVNFTDKQVSLGEPVGRIYAVYLSELPGRPVKGVGLHGRAVKGQVACLKPGYAVFLSDQETHPGNPWLRIAWRSGEVIRKAHFGGGVLAGGPVHLNFGAKKAARAFLQHLNEAASAS